MREDRDYARFFASMNLFVCSMLLLVMADNLVLMYLGWEGVGLCSYLLIGFWYEKTRKQQRSQQSIYHYPHWRHRNADRIVHAVPGIQNTYIFPIS